jgi:predicted membrane channel-forming protein YqfA (hemolysin III family)
VVDVITHALVVAVLTGAYVASVLVGMGEPILMVIMISYLLGAAVQAASTFLEAKE